MKFKLLTLSTCLFSMTAFAQTENGTGIEDDIDWQEDTTEIVTINDIIRDEMAVAAQKYNDNHIEDVWGRRSYLNLSYNSATLKADQTINTGVNNGVVDEFKSDWGFSMTWGRSYRLHKPAISNIVQFNMDYTWTDLSINHFKAVGDGKNIYDSRKKYNSNTGNIVPVAKDGSVNTGTLEFRDAKFYLPWNVEKYEVSYGMSIGPSVTVAPFTALSNKDLHYLKFNMYFHIGYQASLIAMKYNADADVNQPSLGTNNPDLADNYYKELHEGMKDESKHSWGHGLTTTFGLNLSWKFIGLGYEHYAGSVKYVPLVTSEFGDNKYKIKKSYSRVFIQFRF